MKFDKIQRQHITLALHDFKEKGLPDGFKASAYFDVEIDGELYLTDSKNEVYDLDSTYLGWYDGEKIKRVNV